VIPRRSRPCLRHEVRCLLFPAAVALATACPAEAQGVFSPAYESAVQRYRAGDDEAAELVCRWPPHTLRQEVEALLAALARSARRAGDAAARMALLQVPARAALMVHADCVAGAGDDRPTAALHESLGAEIARSMHDHEPSRGFVRRWYLAMIGLAVGQNRWLDGLGWADRGLRDFPGAAELLLASGSIQENVALQTARGDPPPDLEVLADPGVRRVRSQLLLRREVRQWLEKARQALVDAAAADPSLGEAHLRLGRVAWRLGEPGAARPELERVLSGRHSASEAFLARLFLGRLDEDAGRLDEAARSYEAALALEVNSQSARLALSHVRLLRGDPATARAEAERAVRPGGSRLRPDPFWLYPWGPSIGLEDRLEALRREARS
jgi:tetratricopeptide (TPR) repeat protein